MSFGSMEDLLQTYECCNYSCCITPRITCRGRKDNMKKIYIILMIVLFSFVFISAIQQKIKVTLFSVRITERVDREKILKEFTDLTEKYKLEIRRIDL